MKTKKVTLTEKEWEAITSLCELALASVDDAEFDHMENKKTKRRNGGYSADARTYNKALLKAFKQLEKQ